MVLNNHKKKMLSQVRPRLAIVTFELEKFGPDLGDDWGRCEIGAVLYLGI